MKCWARELGGCSNKISLEHYVSKSAFNSDEISVQGFEWCLTEPRKISLSKLGIKILCTKHNNELGEEVDLEGVRLFKFLQNNILNNDVLVLNGYYLERWLLKTIINLNIKSKNRLGVGMVFGGSTVPIYFQHIVFGKTQFTHKMGLYVLPHNLNHDIDCSGLVIQSFVKNGEIGAVYFNIYGLGVVLAMYPGYFLPSIKSLGVDLNIPLNHMDVLPVYRPKFIEIHQDKIYKKVQFNWE